VDERGTTAERTADAVAGTVIGERRLAAGLLAAIAVLNVANAINIAILDERNGWLLLGQEKNPSTWFSAAQLALAAALAWAVGRGRRDADRWNIVAGILLVLSIDEVSTFHEKLGGLPLIPGIGDRGWAGAGLLLVALVAWKLVPWALALEPHLRFGLLAGAATFVLGAVGLEVVAAGWEVDHGQDRMFWAISAVEEDFELLGVFLVVRVLLAQLRAAGTRLTFAIGAG
jgi:hypothetical protein